MPKYDKEFKESIIKKMMPPQSKRIAELSEETGITIITLYKWRREAIERGNLVPLDPNNPENWSGALKLAAVIESASMNEAELSEYCRKRGLYVEQIEEWKELAIAGNDRSRLTSEEKAELKRLKLEKIKTDKELKVKEKALAEAAVLLILEKKRQEIWGLTENEEN